MFTCVLLFYIIYDMKKGFTVIELLIVVSIISFLSSLIFASVQSARYRATDAKTQSTLIGVRNTVEASQVGLPVGVKDYTKAVSNGATAYDNIMMLASSMNLLPNQYQYKFTKSEYAVVFPLVSMPGYWCVDSEGASKKVPGLINGTVFNCDQAGVPGITLLGANPAAYQHVIACDGNNYDVYNEPGYIAMDSAGNDITNLVVVGPAIRDTNPSSLLAGSDVVIGGITGTGHKDYTVTDPLTNLTTLVQRGINFENQVQECASPQGGLDVPVLGP